MNLAEYTNVDLVDELTRRSGHGVFVALMGTGEAVRKVGAPPSCAGEFFMRIADDKDLAERMLKLVATALVQEVCSFRQTYGVNPDLFKGLDL